MISQSGSLRLFRVAGIEVFLHWSWFVVAVVEIYVRRGGYSSVAWNVAEYLSLFVIVLMHEFGHALACRQVGGQANRITLWPLGGVAFVAPPQRPGAFLWAIAAGPLVNVVLLPITAGMVLLAYWQGWETSLPDAYQFVKAVAAINAVLLAFNMLPVYPLDGGQIFRSLLWFWLGRARSLKVATLIGFVGAAGLILIAWKTEQLFLGAVAVFLGLNCWRAWKHAGALSQMEQSPRRAGFACPSCHAAPPLGALWGCSSCRATFDTFATGGVCPNCQTHFGTTACPHCGVSRPMPDWVLPPPGARTAESA